MNLRDILVFLDESGASEGRLQLAITIARDHGASLSAVFLQNDIPDSSPGRAAPWVGLGVGPVVAGAIMTSPRAMLADDAEQQFRDRLRSANVKGDWYPVDRTDTAELIALAQAADLVVIGQTDPAARPAPTWRPEEIVVGCGRPVLMIPYVGRYPQVGQRVLIAWDGSREAVRALNDALPLIRAADVVTVMTVRARPRDLKTNGGSMDRVLRHLSRHGITAHPVEALQSGVAISDVLLSRSVDLAADLIVAGAYHHSQLRETLLGGVSKALFQHMTLPVLMSH
ncbi:universal stress protein [Acidisphaera sp. S103]|uniref:universal stress protein n=1 Tax=Acidisphaera sp. S103 TaxID=1747223 RepID=UPI00131B5D27|nr:universal stress protein [Acidisphaera sp. S103]